MQKRTREILALVLLGVLALVAVFAMGYYMLVGHNWNVAASTIDDSIGQLDGYTVFLYEGVGMDRGERSSEVSTSIKGDSSSSTADASDAVEQSQAESTASLTEGASSDTAASSKALKAISESTTSADLSKLESLVGSDDTAMTFDEVVRQYRDKGATVFVLDVTNMGLYAEPFVTKRNGKSIGLFSNMTPYRKTVTRRAVRDFGLVGVNCVVAFTDDVVDDDSATKGLTVLIGTDQELVSTKGSYIGSTYCVGVPYEGEVQAIIMSPSGVMMTKTITEL